jgi:hypothetical protein
MEGSFQNRLSRRLLLSMSAAAGGLIIGSGRQLAKRIEQYNAQQ